MEPKWYTETNRTWGDLFNEVADRFPSHEALIFGSERLTYRELRRRIDICAKGLMKIGVRRGDHVAVWMTNSPEWIYVQFAVYKLGAALLPVYTRFKPSEVEYSLQQSDSSTLILNDRFLGKIDAMEMFKGLCPEVDRCKPGELSAERLPRLKRVVCFSERDYTGMFSFSKIMELGDDPSMDAGLQESEKAVDPFDVMNIIYTSGTTGFPKGGLSMHRNNMACIYNTTARMGLNEQDRSLLNLPLFSNFGCMYVAGLSFMRGAALVMQVDFNPLEAFRAIEEEKITHIYGSPAMFISYVDEPKLEDFDLSSLRGGIVGGSPLPPKTMEEMVGQLGLSEALNVYGLSECGGLATTNLADDPIEKKANTVGVALENCRIKIVDPETGAELAAGGQGEVCLHDVLPGSSVGKGYYNMPEKTREAIDEEGWFHTGDLGVMGEDGYLRITGRVKDMFLVGGFNVYPVEIENVMIRHPKVSKVQVVGVPDHRMGEVGLACVQLKAGASCAEAELIDFAKGELANFKVPRYVAFVDDFPMTGSGKVKKFELREEGIRKLGLTEEYKVVQKP
jgi:fatty-acyl-CoA synthase